MLGLVALDRSTPQAFPSSPCHAPPLLSSPGLCLRRYALRAAGIAGPRFVELSGFQIIPVRYIEWSCTTPLLVLLCAVMVNAPTGATVRVILADFFCIVLGGVALCLPLAPRIVVVIVCCACGVLWAVVSPLLFGALGVCPCGCLRKRAGP